MTEAHIETAARKPTHAEKAATAYKLPDLWEKDAIKADQNGIKKDLNSLDLRLHINAVQCLMHAEKHGDTSLFRRLLVEIVDDKSGYRRQGIIGWMRKYSPLELVKDNIRLSGLDKDGNKRPFRIEDADQNPFRSASDMKERPVMPIFRDTMLSPIQRAMKQFDAAIDNTGADGKPIDKSKPYYDGLHADKVKAAMEAIKGQVIEITSFADSTKDVFINRQKLAEAQKELEEQAA